MHEETDFAGVKALMQALGGPDLMASDIAAASEFEAGKILLGWLESQITTLDDEFMQKFRGIVDEEYLLERWTETSLREVALEKDEVSLLKSRDLPIENVETIRQANMPLSRKLKHGAYITQENDLVHGEAEVLRSRLDKVKEASRKSSQSIKSLQKAVHALDATTRNSSEKLSELSLEVDTKIASTVSDAQGLLQRLGYIKANAQNGEIPDAPGDDGSDLQSARILLLDARNDISSCTSRLREGLDLLSLLRQGETAKIQDLDLETGRLEKVLESVPRRDLSEDTENELLELCSRLEAEALDKGQERTMDNIFSEILSEVEVEATDDGLVEVDQLKVGDVLRHAWAQDQAASLAMEETILDEALKSLQSALHPLDGLHASLSRFSACIQEAEAVVEAFGEELGDIMSSNNDIERDEANISMELDDAEMERELKRVLTENQALRPADTPPLILLNREDILNELQAVQSRLQATESIESASTTALIRQSSFRPLHKSLPQIYTNSPLNTSPPFELPAHVRELDVRARKIANELQSLASSLEEEVRETFSKGGGAKRLDTFIEKWVVKL